MEHAEKRDLPGNDASWYLSLLLDENGTPEATDEAPVQQSLLLTAPQDDADETLEESPPQDSAEPEEPEDGVGHPQDETEPPPELEKPDDEPEQPEVDPEQLEAEPVLPESEPSQPAAGSEPLDEEAEQPEADSGGAVQPPTMRAAKEPVEFPAEGDESDPAASPGEAAPADPSPLVTVVPEADAPIDNTSEMVGQLWEASEPASPFDDWEPEDMDDKVSVRRPFRWTSIVAALAVIALIVVGLILLPSITRTRADDHREMLTEAMWELRRELPDTQVSLETATEPAATVPQLNDLSTQLTVLSATATVVDEAARTPLPSAPPFTSSDPIDELAPVQQRLEPLATTAHTIQRRISDLVEYRTLMDGFLDLPELPTEADNSAQADLRVILASTQAQSAAILTDLPGDVSLSAHTEMARSINDYFSTWQIDYLEALRAQDPVQAEQLIADLDERLIDLDAELIDPLAQIRRQTDTDLIDLARDIDEVMALAEGEQPPP